MVLVSAMINKISGLITIYAYNAIVFIVTVKFALLIRQIQIILLVLNVSQDIILSTIHVCHQFVQIKI